MNFLLAFWLTLANLPAYFSRGHIETNIAYGGEVSQTLDIYVPPGAAAKRDVVVFFYGGRWSFGKKEDYRFVGRAFANEKFITVIVDYRKFPNVRFPAFVEDCAKALGWIYDHIEAYGGDPARIHVTGHSAGAHIGALLASDPRYLEVEGKNMSQVIRDFAGLAGPYAFTPGEPDLIAMFGPPERYGQMQATTFIQGREPPMLLLWGDADTTVTKSNIERLQKKIEEKGGKVRSIIYPGVDHAGIVGALSWLNFRGTPVMRDMREFFSTH